MRILIDIGHPAHVHLFKNFAWEMEKKGNKIFFTCRNKEFEIYLLEKYKFKYKSFGNKYSSRYGKFWGLIEFDTKEFIEGLKFKPDIFLSHGSMYAAHAAFLLGKPHIAFEDTGNKEQVRLYKPFTKVIFTSNVFPFDYKEKQIRYDSHHELAYLHPKYFLPSSSFIQQLNLENNEPYALVRFVSWKATHDYNQKGLSPEEKINLIKLLTQKMKVFISSEAELPDEFKSYKLPISPDQIHDAMFYAAIFIGEGTTMAMEAAVLGTPSFYISPLQYANCMDMNKYGLLFNHTSFESALPEINKILSSGNLKADWQKRREKMLADKIDVTAFLVWFVENYPESVKVMKENPEYQSNFR